MDVQLQGAALPRVRWTCAVGRAGLAVILAVGLAGCTSASSAPPTTTVSSAAGEDPSESPGSTPEPSSSSEPEPAAEPDPEPEPTQSDDRSELLIQPDDMAKTGRAGAIAAAKYYMGLYEYVYLTGDLEPWNSMARRGCEYCEVVSDAVARLHDSGGHRVSGPPTWVGKAKSDHIAVLDEWEVTLRARVKPSVTYDADGNITKEYKAARNKVIVGAKYDGSSWGITGIAVFDDD